MFSLKMQQGITQIASITLQYQNEYQNELDN